MNALLTQLQKRLFGARTHKHLQINALDGVRGLAVLFVLFSHAANINLVIWPNLRISGNGSGQFGVYLFFSLSAFLITRGLIRKDNEALKHPALWVDYFVRRIFRVFPLFTFVLVLIWIAFAFVVIREHRRLSQICG